MNALSASSPQDLSVVAVGASAELPVHRGAIAGGWWAGVRPRAAARTAVACAVTLSVVAAALAALGAARPVKLFLLLGTGAVLGQLWPRLRRLLAVCTGVLALVALNPVFGGAFAGLVGLLAVLRRRAWPFAAALLGGALVLPKMAFWRHYHQPGAWNWINEPSLALALFAGALWWRARVDGARAREAGQGDAPPADALSFLLLYFMPGHAAFPMAFSPRALRRHDGRAGDPAPDLRAIAALLGWFVLKAASLFLLRTLAPAGFLRDLGEADVLGRSRAELWCVVLASYVELYLTLAATADVPVLIARLYGWSLPDPFRGALLAWNPLELWRRWGLYNRALLLQLVYFPLGGGKRHRYRNVMLTFLGSAVLLHSGWFGSKY